MRHSKKTQSQPAEAKTKKNDEVEIEPSINSALDAILSPFWAPRMTSPDIHFKRDLKDAG